MNMKIKSVALLLSIVLVISLFITPASGGNIDVQAI